MTNFEALREMGAFTEDMFNRIIAFQEKEHPAWNPELSFAQRISGLPLHNLIFSNPDRDPNKFGPTVAAYYPLREEIQKIADYIKRVSDRPLLCDLFPGNGFIGSLIGREGVEVIGLRQPEVKPNQITAFHDDACFTYSEHLPGQLKCDAVLASWPPSGVNPGSLFLDCKPKMAVYIFTDHIDPSSGLRQTGSDDMMAELAEHYREIDTWTVERPQDLLHDIWPDMTPSIEEIRQVHIFQHNSLAPLPPLEKLPPSQPYDWEKDLNMALLARQAKREIEARGFPVT